ncbi:hypothetical protein ACGFH8_12510 [Micromonospora sp. NPDC049175]|uniref:DUF7710 domain-containing protein n=1 Tax=Micromonospora sp. NPDC049175 TaxID=3364266 RepID=UPI003714E93B
MVNGGSGDDARRVWIFHGDAARFASGVFDDKVAALEWIARHGITGILAEYQVGDGCYDFAVREGRFHDTKKSHGSPDHVASFSPGLAHVHVREGQPDL